jgi:hypothetical protein
MGSVWRGSSPSRAQSLVSSSGRRWALSRFRWRSRRLRVGRLCLGWAGRRRRGSCRLMGPGKRGYICVSDGACGSDNRMSKRGYSENARKTSSWGSSPPPSGPSNSGSAPGWCRSRRSPASAWGGAASLRPVSADSLQGHCHFRDLAEVVRERRCAVSNPERRMCLEQAGESY